MAYIDKKIAMQYLANSEKIFDKLKTNFLNTYKNFKPQMESYIKNNDFDSIHNLIHQIKGISLNIGSEVLYDDSIKILDEKYGHENIKVVKDVYYTVDVIISDSNKQE